MNGQSAGNQIFQLTIRLGSGFSETIRFHLKNN